MARAFAVRPCLHASVKRFAFAVMSSDFVQSHDGGSTGFPLGAISLSWSTHCRNSGLSTWDIHHSIQSLHLEKNAKDG
jgi:hypothetical protein